MQQWWKGEDVAWGLSSSWWDNRYLPTGASGLQRPSDTFCLAELHILSVRLSKLKGCMVFYFIHISCFSQRPGQLEKASVLGSRILPKQILKEVWCTGRAAEGCRNKGRVLEWSGVRGNTGWEKTIRLTNKTCNSQQLGKRPLQKAHFEPSAFPADHVRSGFPPNLP